MTDKQNSHSIYRVRQRHAVKELPLKVSTEIIDNNQEETHHIQMSSTPVKQHNHTGKKSHIIATQNISETQTMTAKPVYTHLLATHVKSTTRLAYLV